MIPFWCARFDPLPILRPVQEDLNRVGNEKLELLPFYQLKDFGKTIRGHQRKQLVHDVEFAINQ
jgi:hypothetical protein